MKKSLVLAGLLGLGVGIAVMLAMHWGERGPGGHTIGENQKVAIEQIVRDYLTKNPEILIEMSAELDRRQAQAQAEAQTKAITENAEALFTSQNGLVAGNPEGDVTVVEFFDYNCGYCERALDSVLKLVETDPRVKLVFKEFPIFGEDSEAAAKAAIAAAEQGKYLEMHTRLFKDEGKASLEKALKIAEDLGLDIEKFKSDMASAETQASLDATRRLAEKLGVQGTPLYVVGNEIVPGAPDNLHEVLVATAEEVRKSGCGAGC